MNTDLTIKKGLNANMLKFIAIAAMTVDHLLWTFYPGNDNGTVILLLHIIGRLTAPIMCYFIAEGYHYTRNVKKYAIRLFAFAVVSHFTYNFAFGRSFIPSGILNQTSVMWPLAWGLVALAIVDSKNPKWKAWMKISALAGICVVSFPADWSCIAVLIIVCFGMNRGKFKKQMLLMMLLVSMYTAVYMIFMDIAYGLLQLTVFVSIPFLYLYNGQRGEWKGMKWLFYIYYPLHLVVCGIIRLILYGNI